MECRGTVGTLGDRKNVITANVSMQFWGNVSTDLVPLPFHFTALLLLGLPSLVFLSRSNTKLSVILEIVKGIA